jgi:hypothetical protein
MAIFNAATGVSLAFKVWLKAQPTTFLSAKSSSQVEPTSFRLDVSNV